MIRRLRQIQAVADVTCAALRLRLFGFARATDSFLNAKSEAPSPHQSRRLQTARDALVATAPLPWSTCLTRSLALCRRARRMGLQPTLRLGVRSPGTGFLAHAWVELPGLPLEEDRPAGYLHPVQP